MGLSGVRPVWPGRIGEGLEANGLRNSIWFSSSLLHQNEPQQRKRINLKVWARKKTRSAGSGALG